MNIAIIPAGQWGASLAIPLLDNGHIVTLWFETEEEAHTFDATHTHSRHAKILFPKTVRGTSDLSTAVTEAEAIILAPPSPVVRAVAKRVAKELNRTIPFLSITKGLDADTFLRPSEVINQEFGARASQLAVLSGPNFAVEVAMRKPTATVIASTNTAISTKWQTLLSTAYFRVYLANDCAGVELGGALKNVYALGVGICDGMGLGDNARAALITRSLHEMVKIGVKLGAQQRTFMGLSGIGDLLMTCTSSKSRNHQAGIDIGQGVTLVEVRKQHVTVEGLNTLPLMMKLVESLSIETPILHAIDDVVNGNTTPADATRALLARQAGSEF